ncbi:hypothetical protein AZZ88_001408, partial [Escherichia coli]
IAIIITLNKFFFSLYLNALNFCAGFKKDTFFKRNYLFQSIRNFSFNHNTICRRFYQAHLYFFSHKM